MLFLSNRSKPAAGFLGAVCWLSLAACHDDDLTANDLPVLGSDVQTESSNLPESDVVSDSEASEELSATAEASEESSATAEASVTVDGETTESSVSTSSDGDAEAEVNVSVGTDSTIELMQNTEASEASEASSAAAEASVTVDGETTESSVSTSVDDDAEAKANVLVGAESITDLAQNTEMLSTLVAALQAVNLDSVLADTSEVFTVFAPTNDAFAALGVEALTELLGDPDALNRVLLNHVITGESVNAETAMSLVGTTVTNASSENLGIAFNDDALTVNNATVVQADVTASNGVVHVIDQVLVLPPDEPEQPQEELPSILETVLASDSFSTLAEALEVTGLDTELANEEETFTVFAPTDEAFAALGSVRLQNLLTYPKLLSPILLRHAIIGTQVSSAQAFALVGQSVDTAAEDRQITIRLKDGQLFVDNAQVVMTDIQARNGVIHVIDAVICSVCSEGEENEEEAVEDGVEEESEESEESEEG